MLNKVNGNNTILDIVMKTSTELKQSKIMLSYLAANFLSLLSDNDFVKLKNKPVVKSTTKHQKHPIISAPNQISWIITNKCNLNCSHCANANSKEKKNELSTKEALKFVDECAENKVFVLNISGGEPFARKDIFQILSHARKKDLEIGITTNGTLVTRENCKKLKGIEPFNVHISLDGVGEVHDKFRNKKGIFNKIINTIKLFRQYDIPFGITTSITKINIKNLDNIKDFIINEKITSWEIYYAIPIGNLSKKNSLSKSDLDYLASKIHNYRNQYNIDIFIGDSLGYHCKYNLRDRWDGCLVGLNHLAIGPEGEIKGCPIQPNEFIEGNLRNKPFIEVWRDKNKFSYNRKGVRLTKQCKQCKHKKTCRGGCKTLMYVHSRDLSYNNLCLNA